MQEPRRAVPETVTAGQKIPRKPAPQLHSDTMSTMPSSPARTPPRRPPQHPPHEGGKYPQRPAAHQYGRTPGMTEPGWPLSHPRAGLTLPPPLTTTSRQAPGTNPAPRPYQNGTNHSLRSASHQYGRVPAMDEPEWPAQQNIPLPLHPKPAAQNEFSYPPIPTATRVQPPGPLLPPHPFVVSQNPHAPRSVSQPPPPRRVSQPKPQSNTRRKPLQPDSVTAQLPQSPDPSPRGSPVFDVRGRSKSLAPPPTFHDISTSQTVGSPVSSRPNSYHSDAGSPDGRASGRRSWMPGSRSRQASREMAAAGNGPGAWVISGHTRVAYNVQRLGNAEKVPELWDDNADLFVYLFALESGQGPSFRIPSELISSSPKLRALAFGDAQNTSRRRARSFDGRSTLSAEDAARNLRLHKPNTPPYTPMLAAKDNRTSLDGSLESISSLGDAAREGHLYFPHYVGKAFQTPDQIALGEYDHIISVRNLFAFLIGRPLVATRSSPNIFSVLCLIANHLEELGFSNVDGSTYGEAVSTSLSFYVDDLGLADVSSSREKTLEGIALGERLRSIELYNEAFTHAVGKYEAIKDINSPVWDMITANTRNRLERAFMDLEQRQYSVNVRLCDFEFPSLFAGTAASTSSAASKVVRFKAWKSSFGVIRKHILSYYKDLYGDWPPKAKSKKNNFLQSGLNRLVLKALYSDFCSIYDLLVDRESLTTRSLDAEDILPEGEDDIAATALRQILSEYDRSSPPVQPPVPFDIPKLPSMATVDAKHHGNPLKVRPQAETRRLHAHEAVLILTKSHNLDLDRQTPFLQAFRAFEGKEAKGKTLQELTDQRFGYWLFVYVVLQALPMLVIDAPGLQHTQGVEYFLCQPPKGGAPWMEDANLVRRAWYSVASSSGVVALPSDIVDHGVEAIYRRSHCWAAAERWLDALHSPVDPGQHQQDFALGVNSRSEGFGMSILGPPAPGFMVRTDYEALQERQGRPLSTVKEGLSPSSPPGSDRSTLSPLSPAQQRKPGARNTLGYRRSIAFGLEQLPVPAGYNMSPNVSPQQSPPLVVGHRRSYELGEVIGAGGHDDRFSPMSSSSGDSSGVQGKSFDDILGSLDKGNVKATAKAKRSFIGL